MIKITVFILGFRFLVLYLSWLNILHSRVQRKYIIVSEFELFSLSLLLFYNVCNRVLRVCQETIFILLGFLLNHRCALAGLHFEIARTLHAILPIIHLKAVFWQGSLEIPVWVRETGDGYRLSADCSRKAE